MPIYEEKLICPFALHFTQEHIKTHFQDGRVVEETIPEIEAQQSGSEHFDLILKAPFPNIEILRWQAPDCKDKNVQRWYTLDNRRLYCLQRMAAQHWPKRVGVVVDILYADTGRVRRKYDSITEGRSVTISPSVKVPAIWRWDWHQGVSEVKADTYDTEEAFRTVERDCAKPSVDDLCEVPGPAFETVLKDQTASFVSSLAALLGQSQKQSQPSHKDATASSPTVSTEASSDGSADSRQETPREVEGPAAPKLVWKVKGADEVPEVPGEDVGAEPTESLEEVAVRLILGQVSRPERKGYVWIENWNKRFQKELGTLRGFIESRPDLFQVKPGNGRSYRVEATEPVSAVEKTSSKNRWRRSRRHN
mmetsp:Transcript_63764/g.149472  ORF Transcript_63764/g.149472 Transcript_63764/m.149472 type:complete len:364 (-) Transcript_63764:370-1461(-)